MSNEGLGIEDFYSQFHNSHMHSEGHTPRLRYWERGQGNISQVQQPGTPHSLENLTGIKASSNDDSGEDEE
jgi:hypothetical protein